MFYTTLIQQQTQPTHLCATKGSADLSCTTASDASHTDVQPQQIIYENKFDDNIRIIGGDFECYQIQIERYLCLCVLTLRTFQRLWNLLCNIPHDKNNQSFVCGNNNQIKLRLIEDKKRIRTDSRKKKGKIKSLLTISLPSSLAYFLITSFTLFFLRFFLPSLFPPSLPLYLCLSFLPTFLPTHLPSYLPSFLHSFLSSFTN